MRGLKTHENAAATAAIIASGKRALQIESDAIAAMATRLDGSFARAVEILDGCQRHVIVTGVGKSGLIGKKIAATFSSVGIPSVFLHAADGSHGDLGIVAREDILVAISNSGESEEIIKLLPYVSRINATLISMTGNKNSTLAKRSDIVLDVSVQREACAIGIVPTASTTAAMAMGDALALAILDKRGFKAEDFAQYHPGGSLGRRLLTTVADLMHADGAIPCVTLDANIYAIIAEMSRKCLGATLVTDDGRNLLGIITDGDLRRLLEKKQDITAVRAQDLMCVAPKTITKEQLAAKALQIMEKHTITSLAVTGSGKQIEGFLHLHDLLKAGIV